MQIGVHDEAQFQLFGRRSSCRGAPGWCRDRAVVQRSSSTVLDLVLEIVDRDLVDRAVRDVGKAVVQDRVCGRCAEPVKSASDSSATVFISGFEIMRDLAPQHRLGDRRSSGGAAACDEPFAWIVPQIDLLLCIASRMRSAKRQHQRRTEPILFGRKRHCS